MGQILRNCARTTEEVRRAIQNIVNANEKHELVQTEKLRICAYVNAAFF